MISGYLCEIAAISTIMSFIDAYLQSASVFPLYLYPLLILFGNISHERDSAGVTHVSRRTRPIILPVVHLLGLPVLVYDAVLCLLALWYGIKSWMSGYRTKRMDGVHIADALVKGNAGYFFWYELSASPLSLRQY
ncbi:hypothetical protein J3R83DRAFT_13671 [Lanmaoa asiatica]|nr:hypothetical protein J3R83DRAFT_13671 [Lanmaoa asiatica]